jgi:hypothetical protein
VIDCGLDTGITPAGAGGVDAMSGSNSREGDRCRKRSGPPAKDRNRRRMANVDMVISCECSDSVITSGGSQRVKSRAPGASDPAQPIGRQHRRVAIGPVGRGALTPGVVALVGQGGPQTAI